MYRNIIFVFFLSTVLFFPGAMALQVGNADNSVAADEPGSLNAFLNSDFVRTSVWPGVGPFQNNSNNHLVDPSGNQLTYSTVGKQISSCQLEMRGGSSEGQCMLNLQMSIDFLLESLGLKPGQIHTVNVEVNKSSKLLMGNNYNPIHTTVAPFIVSLQNLGITEGTDNSVYRVVVANQNFTSGNLEINKSEENKNGSDKVEEDKTIEVASVPSSNTPSMANPVQTTDKAIKSSSTSKTKSPGKTENAGEQIDENNVEVIKGSQALRKTPEETNQDVTANENKTDNVMNAEQSPGRGSEPEKVITAPKNMSKEEQLKNDFRDVIQNWQGLKKIVVKERDTKLLSQALSGKALIRQTEGVKWLVSNHKYYEMTPGGAKVEKVSTLVANTKYAVYAEVKEKTKLVDESSGHGGKETDDTYKVNYTIEKIGQKWLITDSALIKGIAEKTADKSGSQKSNTKKPASEKSAQPTTKTPH